jgi:hypothetical protein
MRFANAFLVVVALIGVGCVPKSSDKMVGVWKLDPTSVSTGDASVDASRAASFAKMTIDMKSDKSFTTGDGKSGTYTLEDKAITLTPTAAKGATTEPMQATLSDDLASFSVNMHGEKAMVFRKADG